MRDPLRTIRWLEAILNDPKRALQLHKGRTPGRGIRDFSEDHLPFLLGYLAILLFSPYLWYRVLSYERTPLLKALLTTVRGMLIPVFIVLLFLTFVGLYDRFLENRFTPGPTRSAEIDPEQHNRSLFFALPVSASLLFFWIHPLFGYLMLLAAITYSLIQIVHFQALYEKTTTRRTAAMLIAFGGVFLLPVVALLLAYNLLLTTRILLDLF